MTEMGYLDTLYAFSECLLKKKRLVKSHVNPSALRLGRQASSVTSGALGVDMPGR